MTLKYNNYNHFKNSLKYSYDQNNNSKDNEQKSNNEMINDYFNLIRCTYPYCNCGKCIQRKYRGNNSNTNFSYDKNIQTTYKNEFNWKSIEKPILYKESGHSSLDKGFKAHLKTGLVSIAHRDYKIKAFNKEENTQDLQEHQTKNFLSGIKVPRKNLENKVDVAMPFFGRSSYEILYPNWKTSKNKNEENGTEIKKTVPFCGVSSYKQIYGHFDKRHYVEKATPIYKKDNIEHLGFSEKLFTSTTSHDNYQPINMEKSKDWNNLKPRNGGYPEVNVSAPFAKDSFVSSYKRAFMGNNFLNSRKNLFDNSVKMK